MKTDQKQSGEIALLKKFNDYIRNPKTEEYLQSVLKGKKESFVTSLVSVVTNSTALQACDPASVMFTAMKATALGLPIDPNLGFAALIPYRDNKAGKTLAQFQIMRDGWVELLQRSGQVKFIANEPVHEGELIRKNKFTGEFVFDENSRKSNKVIGYMAYVKLTNGFEKTVYWTAEECERHAKTHSKTFKSNDPKVKASSLWSTDFEAMALKTVLKHLIKKYMPKSIEINSAIAADQASFFTNNGDPDYLDGIDRQEVIIENVQKVVAGQKESMRKVRNQNEEVQEVLVEETTEIAEVEQPNMVSEGRIFNDLP